MNTNQNKKFKNYWEAVLCLYWSTSREAFGVLWNRQSQFQWSWRVVVRIKTECIDLQILFNSRLIQYTARTGCFMLKLVNFSNESFTWNFSKAGTASCFPTAWPHLFFEQHSVDIWELRTPIIGALQVQTFPHLAWCAASAVWQSIDIDFSASPLPCRAFSSFWPQCSPMGCPKEVFDEHSTRSFATCPGLLGTCQALKFMAITLISLNMN